MKADKGRLLTKSGDYTNNVSVELRQIIGSQKVFLSGGQKLGVVGVADQQLTGGTKLTLSCGCAVGNLGLLQRLRKAQFDRRCEAQSNPELSQVMINVEIGIAHALSLRHLPKHGMRSEIALQSTEALRQSYFVGEIQSVREVTPKCSIIWLLQPKDGTISRSATDNNKAKAPERPHA